MHPLLRFTLDLFEPNKPLTPENKAQTAIKNIAPALPVSPAYSASPATSEPPLPPAHLADLLAPASFRHPRANREARLCDAVVAYEFKRAKRRTIGFAVGPDGLVVSAPKWVPLHEVDTALQKKSSWIIRKLGETRERHQRLDATRIEWCDGTTMPFLGEPVRVVLDPRHDFGGVGAELRTVDAGLILLVGLSHAARPEQIRDAVQAWLMRQAKQLFLERLDHFAPQLQVQWRKLSLSNARTRWGSARIDGSIRLNWRLIHFRQPVIDYVVVHELSHLRVMDHSPRFWDTVRAVVPDYAQLRRQLKDDSTPRWT